MNKLHYIYIYENKINNNVYIGQTYDIKKRDREHILHGCESMPIDCAIKKYGRDNFSLTTMAIVDTDDEADQQEIFWISYIREFLGKSKVYNIQDGGRGNSKGQKVVHSEATRLKMSTSGKIKIFSSEHRANMSIAQTGRKHTENTKNKMRGENNIGAKLNDIKVKEIRQSYATGRYTVILLAKQFGVAKSTILRVLKNKAWSYIEYEQYDLVISILNNNKNMIPAPLIGEKNPNAKLNYVKAQEIRALYATGSYFCKQLAKQFNVGTSTIVRIINNKVWKK